MKKYTIAQYLMAGGMVGGVLFADTASAIDWNITGFVRQEIAYSLNSDGNPNNDMDNPFNDRIQPNITHHEFGSHTTPTANPGDYFPALDAVGLVPFAGTSAGSNSRARAHTYWGQKTDGTELVPAPTGPNPLGISLNTEFMTAGNNTNSPVDCHYSQQRALAGLCPWAWCKSLGLGRCLPASVDHG